MELDAEKRLYVSRKYLTIHRQVAPYLQQGFTVIAGNEMGRLNAMLHVGTLWRFLFRVYVFGFSCQCGWYR